MGFFKTVITGYKLLFQEINRKHNNLFPRAFTGCGTGMMMIGSAVMARTAMKEDVQQIIAEANAAVDEAKAVQEGEKKQTRVVRIFRAKAVRGWKIVKVFRKSLICEAIGVAGIGTGYAMAEKGKKRALKAVGALGTAFAAYRANVREDLGDEADRRYLTGQKAVKHTEKINKKTGEVTHELEYIQDGGVTIQKDPSAFKFWFSKETCPSLWSDNRDLCIANLDWVENGLTLRFQTSEHISLNDQRREFGGLIPANMDVDIGGIFGKVLKPDIPKMQQRINLHYRDDRDFMEGRTDGCWILFDCDPEPIIGRTPRKMTEVER